MSFRKILIGFVVAGSATGCATVTHDANQQVKIETYAADKEQIKDAKCTAKNERGEWSVTTPGSLSVHRSSQNLEIKCEKEGQPLGTATAISRANGGMFGNILLGGGIGAIVDHNKGTAYNYPGWLQVTMGESLVFDRRDETDEGIPSPVHTGEPKNPSDQASSAPASLMSSH